QRGLWEARVEIVLITAGIVDSIENHSQIKPGIWVWASKWHRNSGEQIAKADRPDADSRAFFGTAYQGVVIATRKIGERHLSSAPKQIDFHEVDRTGEDSPALPEILFPIWSRPFVRGAEKLDDRYQFARPAVAQFQK